MYERNYVISTKEMGGWKPTASHDPTSVNSSLHDCKQVELHLVLKTVQFEIRNSVNKDLKVCFGFSSGKL